jgi:hypothetical protein
MTMKKLLPDAKKLRKGSKDFSFVEVSRCRYLDNKSIEPSPQFYVDDILPFFLGRLIFFY